MTTKVRHLCKGRPRVRWGAILFGIALGLPGAAAAQTGEVNVRFVRDRAFPPSLPAMVSILRDGEIVRQHEVLLELGAGIWCCVRTLPVGSYDVRVEAEGLVTQVKRGVRILDGQAADISFVGKKGTGLHVVEYATGGLSREEVAARLTALEAAVTKLQQAMPKGPAPRP